jgi:hypothetical protein
LRNFALRLDIPIQTARQLQIEAKLTGVNIATLEQGVRTLSAAVDDLGGSGKKQAAVLRELGIATRELDGSDRALGSAFLDVFNKLSDMTNATQRAHDGTVLLGRGFKELLPAIELHSQLSAHAKQLASAYGDQVNPEFVKAKAAIEELGIEFDALEKNLLLKVVPALIEAAKWVGKILPGKENDDKHQARYDALHGKPLYTLDRNDMLGRFDQKMSADALVATNVGLSQETSFIDEKYLNPLEKLEAKLKEIKKEIAELNKGGVVQLSDLAKYDSLQKDEAAQKVKIQAYKDNITYQKELTRAMQEYSAKAAAAEGAELSILEKLKAERISTLSLVDQKFKSNPDLKAFVNREFDAKIKTEENKERDENLHHAAENKVQALEHEAAIQGRLIELSAGQRKSHADVTLELEKQLAIIEKIYDVESHDPKAKDQADDRREKRTQEAKDNARVQNVEIDNRDARLTEEHRQRMVSIQDEFDNKKYANQASFTQRFLTATMKPGDEIATAQQVEQIQYELEQKRLQVELQRAILENDTNKAAELSLKLRLSDEENLLKVREEGELRIAEIQKRNREEFEQGAAKIFDALTNKNGGFQQLVQTELHNLEKTLFVNSAGILFNQTGGQGLGLDRLVSGQRGPDGKLNTLGQLLQGTPFGDKGTSAVSTATLKTADNTLRTAVAVETLANTVTLGAGGGGVPGAGGDFPISGLPLRSFGDIAGLMIEGGGTGFSGLSTLPGLAGTASRGSSSGLGNFINGAVGLPLGTANVWNAITGDDYGVGGPGHTVTASSLGLTTGAARAGTLIGAAGTVFAGVEGAIKGFSKGGVGGDSSGIASIAGTAAALDPEPLSKAVLAGVALVSSIVGSIFGDNKQKRADQISAYIANNNTSDQYITDPTTGALSLNPNFRGRAISEDYDISGANAIYNSNGKVTAAGTTVVHNWNVSTLSPQSFLDHQGPITDAVNSAMLLNHPINNTISQQFAQ